MNYLIWEHNRPRRSIPPGTVMLRLIKSHGSAVKVVAVDHQGRAMGSGNILELSLDQLRLYTSVDRNIGLPLDNNGRILVT